MRHCLDSCLLQWKRFQDSDRETIPPKEIVCLPGFAGENTLTRASQVVTVLSIIPQLGIHQRNS